MDEAEMTLRLEKLDEMFQTYGIRDPGERRLRSYGNLTAPIPIEIDGRPIFEPAIDLAMRLNLTSFPPAPGQIIDAARSLTPSSRPALPGTPLRWFQEMKALRQRTSRGDVQPEERLRPLRVLSEPGEGPSDDQEPRRKARSTRGRSLRSTPKD